MVGFEVSDGWFQGIARLANGCGYPSISFIASVAEFSSPKRSVNVRVLSTVRLKSPTQFARLEAGGVHCGIMCLSISNLPQGCIVVRAP